MAQTSTRNTAFNSYILDGTIYSSVSKTATKGNPNIQLLDSDEAVLITGAAIIAHAKENKALKKHNVYINTDDVDKDTVYLVYGAPNKKVLDNQQQYNNCGIDSALNVLVMAGKKAIKNQKSTETSFTKQMWNLGIADDDGKLGVFDYQDGGTNPTTYKEIFEYYGINSETYCAGRYLCDDEADNNSGISLEELGEVIKNGGAAIVGVCADILWKQEHTIETLTHAIAVTGVIYSPDDLTKPAGFYIHDTGAWMTRYISYDEMAEITMANSEYGGKTVTGVFGTVVTDNIKKATDNINATGTDYANTIIGNSGDNVIKGLGGDDILVGGAGNDKIYGGNGSDIIFGNGVIVYADSGYKGTDFYIKDEVTDAELVGRNYLNGGNGNDYIYGGNYNDTIYGGNGNDYIHGGEGTDVICGGNGNDIIFGETGNDRIYGNAGNDTIYGGTGEDVIIAGSGNDSVWSGQHDDKVDCGSGNDHVYYENNCGKDTVASPSGSVNLHFTDTDLYSLDYNISGKNLTVSYDDDNKVTFNAFYNSSTNTCKKAYLRGQDEVAYRLTATNAKSAKVTNSAGNNVLFVTGNKNHTVTTSKGNDIVYSYGMKNDTFTYTGGKDLYYSEFGDDKYKINSFSTDTVLAINDNTYMKVSEDSTEENVKYIDSSNDSIIFSADKSQIALLFNVTVENHEPKAIVTASESVYFMNTDLSNEDYKNLVNGNDVSGYVEVKRFFGAGRMENMSADNVAIRLGATLDAVAQEVASWLVNNNQTDAFEAIKNEVSDIDTLLSYYSNVDWSLKTDS